MIKEESEMTVEESRPVEEIFNVELVEGDSSKVKEINGELQSPLKEEIIKFLKGNLGVFARSCEDMHGIDGRVKKYHLDGEIFAPERNKAVMEEVDKFLIASFIYEIHYLEGLAKHRHGKKKNIRWKIEGVYGFQKPEQCMSQRQLSQGLISSSISQQGMNY